MPYRARHVRFNLVLFVPILLWGVAGLRWIGDADPGTNTPIVRGVVVLIPLIGLLAFAHYWPTRRRPPRLYHLTSRAAAHAAIVATHLDGTVTVELRARNDGQATFFFPRQPRRSVVLYNLKAEPEVCIDLHGIDYAGVQVRRRITGAYRLRGRVDARATIRPFPAEDR